MSSFIVTYHIEARTDYENADKALSEWQEKLEIAERQFRSYRRGQGHKSEISVEDYLAGNLSDTEITTEEGIKFAKAVITARLELEQAETARNQAKRNYEATSEYFEKLDDLQEAYSLGQYDRMAEIVYAEKDLTSTTLDESATDAEERFRIYSESMEKILSHFQLNARNISQTAVDELGKELEEVMKNASLTEEDPKEVWEKNFKKYFDEYLEKGLDVSPMIAFADDLEMSPADLSGDKWRDVIKKQRENGHDITDFLQLAINSGYYPEITFGSAENFNDYLWERLSDGQDIEYLLDWGFSKGSDDLIKSNEFQTAYRETIQEHLEKGLDVDGLLKWSNKASLASSEEFVDVFKKTVGNKLENDEEVGSLLEWGNQLGIDMGDVFGERFSEQMETLHANEADMTAFIKWAESNGKRVGEIFGENFQELLKEFLAIPIEEIETATRLTDDKLTKNLVDYYENGQDLSTLAKQAMKQGKQIGDVFGDNYMEVIQQQIQKGYDITNLVQWAENSGEKVSKEYSDVYTDIIQTCIDKGYDISELLKWGEESGFNTGDMLGKHYTSEVQKFVDDGFSVSELIEWAIINGKKIGEIFGENFRSIADEYIDRQEKIEYIRQEIADISGFWGNIYSGNKKVKFMADGGFLSHGQAVVAEAGPELLEVMNGGVKVTPLTRSAQNTALSNGGQKIFYSNYTINATISGGYDVRRLAEDLETERRQLESGIGK